MHQFDISIIDSLHSPALLRAGLLPPLLRISQITTLHLNGSPRQYGI